MNIALLEEIKQLIMAEPLRLSMENWSSAATTRPACDTVGCLFGWAVAADRVRHKQVSMTDGENMLAGYAGDFFDDGRAILGLTENEALRLAYVGFWPQQFKADVYREMSSDALHASHIRTWHALDNPQPGGEISSFRMAAWPVAGNLQPQTLAYAELVARRIDHFIATEGRE